jgi:hypothetical protein
VLGRDLPDRRPADQPTADRLFENVVHQEAVFQQFGRFRAVATGPDGSLYVLLQDPTGAGTGVGLSASTRTMVTRHVPVEK